MNRSRIFLALAVFILVLAAAKLSWARMVVPLVDQQRSGASGEAEIEWMEFMPGQRAVGINVYRLQPNSLYTVWFANELPLTVRAPAGIDTNYFKTDANGNGRYVTTSSDYELRKWRYIEVGYHPDRNPVNTKDMVVVLIGDLKYGFHY